MESNKKKRFEGIEEGCAKNQKSTQQYLAKFPILNFACEER